jgi:hypothetical protein
MINGTYKNSLVFLGVALGFFIVGMVSPTLGSLLAVPLMIFLTSRRDISYWPAMMVLFAGNTYASYAFLASTLLISAYYLKTIIQRAPICKWLITVYYMLLPIVVYLYIRNAMVLGWVSSLSIRQLLYYLPISIFFYGIVCNITWNKRISQVFPMAFISLMILQRYHYNDDEFVPIAGMFFVYSCASSSLIAWLFMADKRKQGALLISGVLALISAMSGGSTLTIFSTVVYAILVCLSASLFPKLLLRVFVSWLWVPIIIGLIYFGITHYSNYRLKASERGSSTYEELQEKWSVSNLKERILIKFYGDRSVLWAAGWENVKQPPYVLPDLIKKPVYVESEGGSRYETDLAVHNYYIESLQECRWILGSGVILLYVWILALASRWFNLKRIDYGLLPYGATVMACGYIHTMSANAIHSYPHLLLGFAGVMYGQYRMRISDNMATRWKSH